jgi:uncharacterized protein with NRDE domain
MCLAVIAFEAHTDWPLIVLANRDEFHDRASLPIATWPKAPHILGGLDLVAGGTWLALDNTARLALLTNVRDPNRLKTAAPSRGHLPANYLTNHLEAKPYLEQLVETAHRYNGFNLLISEISTAHRSNPSSLWHASNYQDPFVNSVKAGVHGLSNALLNTPWPKTERTTSKVKKYLQSMVEPDPDALVSIMLDQEPVPPQQLPATGVSKEREQLLAPAFIVSPNYGTRCTTLVLQHRNGACWVQEDSYDARGQRISRVRWCHWVGELWQPTELAPSELFSA